MKLPYPADDIAADTSRLIDAATAIVLDRGYNETSGVHYLMVIASALLNTAIATTMFDTTEPAMAPVLQIITE